MGRHSGAGFHFDFLLINSTGTIARLPLGGCVIAMMLYFYLALIWGGYDRDGRDGR